MNRFQKKMLIAVCASLLVIAGVVVYAATTTNVVTNVVGQVITTTTDEYGKVTKTIVDANALSSQSRSRVELSGVLLDSTQSDNTTNTLYTPRDVGDFLVGETHGTGAIWMASGPTTNDWKLIVYHP